MQNNIKMKNNTKTSMNQIINWEENESSSANEGCSDKEKSSIYFQAQAKYSKETIQT